MAISPEMIRQATTTTSGSVSRSDGAGVLEIACLAIVSDGNIAPEELAVLRTVGKDIGSADNVEALVQKAASLHSREAQLERLREVAAGLSTEAARHLAYKVTVLTSVADLAASDEEFEFDLDLVDALQLSTDVADRLAGEVHEAVVMAE